MPGTPSARLAVGACLLALGCLPASAQATSTGAEIRASVDDGAGWAQTQQSASTGAFPVFGFDIVPTALAAAGRNAADVANGGPTSQASTVSALGDLAYDPGVAASVGPLEQGILTGYAAGVDPARVSAAKNVVAELASSYDDGRYGPRFSFNNTVYGALALRRAHAPRFLTDRTVAAIRVNQHNDGGWGFLQSVTPATQAEPSSTDTVGPALAALCESGVPTSDPAVEQGVAFLRAKLDLSTGGFDPQDGFGTPPNADTNGAVISGLNACGIDPQGAQFTGPAGQTPVDFLIGLQLTAGGDAGGFPSAFSGASGDVYATQDAVRALAGAAFTAAPPARTTPTDPRTRPLPVVADGTSVPVSLAVDDGSGGVTFCRVTVPSGASLASLLAAANGGSTPGGCATGAQFTAGQLSRLNGRTGTWAFSVDGGAEQIAAGQAVRFGALVALRRTSGAVPSAPGGAATPPAVPAAVQARTTPAGVRSRSLKVSARRRVVSVSLSCAKENRLCQGAVYLVYRKKTLARRAFLIGGGKTTKLNVKLSKRSVKRLGKKKKRIKVNVFSRDGAGVASTSTRTVTLTPTK